ncbi:MAG: glutamate racemase [Firmicutes bacterium]|jgi:glutamate racemase|nr:glutamate racemase [Bacillota bacterium]NLL89049.1 glutamate racemase [Bacillota bacterium]
MEQSHAPIGIYDSGVGGLTVWLALKRLVKQDLIYYADTAHVPYGEKAREQILFYSHTIISFLKQHKVRAVVAACNTSSALALPTLRLTAGVPLFGVIEPAVREGIAATKNKRIGLMATVGTVDSGSYQRRFHRHAPDVQLFAQKCPKLVPLVEAGKTAGPEVEAALQQYLEPLLKADIDTLILGCTHYPFLLEPIRRIAGKEIAIIDPAHQTAQDVFKWLKENGYADSGNPQDIFWASGNPHKFQAKASFFVGRQIGPVHHHKLDEEKPGAIQSFLLELAPVWRGENDQ